MQNELTSNYLHNRPNFNFVKKMHSWQEIKTNCLATTKWVNIKNQHAQFKIIGI